MTGPGDRGGRVWSAAERTRARELFIRALWVLRSALGDTETLELLDILQGLIADSKLPVRHKPDLRVIRDD